MINGEYSAYHVRVTNVDELQSILNSKYILSHIGTTYQQIKEDLKNGKLVLFGGTPCQALGLKSFLNNEYENLIVVDVICHGVTSKTIFNDYLREVEKEQNIVITDYIFRDKKLDGEAISVIPTMTMAIRIKSKSSVFQKKEPHMKYTI